MGQKDLINKTDMKLKITGIEETLAPMCSFFYKSREYMGTQIMQYLHTIEPTKADFKLYSWESKANACIISMNDIKGILQAKEGNIPLIQDCVSFFDKAIQAFKKDIDNLYFYTGTGELEPAEKVSEPKQKFSKTVVDMFLKEFANACSEYMQDFPKYEPKQQVVVAHWEPIARFAVLELQAVQGRLPALKETLNAEEFDYCEKTLQTLVEDISQQGKTIIYIGKVLN